VLVDEVREVVGLAVDVPEPVLLDLLGGGHLTHSLGQGILGRGTGDGLHIVRRHGTERARCACLPCVSVEGVVEGCVREAGFDKVGWEGVGQKGKRGADLFCVMCSLEGVTLSLSKPWAMPIRNVDSLKLIVLPAARERDGTLLPCIGQDTLGGTCAKTKGVALTQSKPLQKPKEENEIVVACSARAEVAGICREGKARKVLKQRTALVFKTTVEIVRNFVGSARCEKFCGVGFGLKNRAWCCAMLSFYSFF